ncbi:MAG TPA: alpha/beta hydrolase [Mycobacteriales bacterium]|jgi:pimeloyl-ACP methyl ester carboxylesterase|nr:alpha/beta hydrolase [Mycobacteriales bacterium]
MRWRRGGIAAVIGALLSVLAVVIPQPASAAHGGLRWGLCPTYLYPDLRGTDEQCAHLKVPLNYAHPDGAKITLELSRLRHTSSDYKGVILTNPGGPGSPGLDLPANLEPYVPGGVGRDYDWIGWDPRGVGASHPAMHCENNYFKGPRRSYTPSTKSLLHYWLSRTKRYANTCAKKYPGLINHISTVDSAKDMESIRKALGASRISFYGFSYGTYLGEVYSTLYPSRLKYMVLDSNVDPRRVWYDANLDQDQAFDRNIKIYFSWVAKYDSVFHLGTTQKAVSIRYYAQLAALTRHPKGKLGPDEFADAMTGAAYYRFGWTSLAKAWQALAASGKTAPMLQQYADNDLPGDDNEFAVYTAVQCTDAHWPRSWSTWRKDNDAEAAKYPFLTWNNAWYNAPCLYWKGKARTPVTINGLRTKSALLIDETLDAATPYDGSLEARRLYPNSSLIAEPGGTTHADSLSGDACVDNQVAAYLRSGTRPARKSWDGPDSLCSPLPNPHPHS